MDSGGTADNKGCREQGLREIVELNAVEGGVAMVGINWDDLRYFLALSRKETIASAAKHLGVNESTVSRRLKNAEEVLGSRIFERTPSGLRLTETGRALITRLEKAELEIEAAEQIFTTGAGRVAGKVRITAVPAIIHHILVPNLDSLLTLYPELKVELVAESADLSVLHRAADIAIRLARPNREAGAITQKIGSLEYAVYTAKSVLKKAGEKGVPWITYDSEMAFLPQSQWLKEQYQGEAGQEPQIYVNDSETLMVCLKQGLGKSLLPIVMGERQKDLIQDLSEETPLVREIWLLTHPDIRQIERVKVCIDWVRRAIAAATNLSR